MAGGSWGAWKRGSGETWHPEALLAPLNLHLLDSPSAGHSECTWPLSHGCKLLCLMAEEVSLGIAASGCCSSRPIWTSSQSIPTRPLRPYASAATRRQSFSRRAKASIACTMKQESRPFRFNPFLDQSFGGATAADSKEASWST